VNTTQHSVPDSPRQLLL